MKPTIMNMLLIALILAVFSPIASTWSIAFYDDADCIANNYYAYGDDGQSGVSECTRVGTVSDNTLCTFFRDGGTVSEPCADQLDLAALTTIGWGFPDDTTCYVGYDTNCTWPDNYLFTTQDCSDYPAPHQVDEPGEQLYFMCGLEFGGEDLPSVG